MFTCSGNQTSNVVDIFQGGAPMSLLHGGVAVRLPGGGREGPNPGPEAFAVHLHVATEMTKNRGFANSIFRRFPSYHRICISSRIRELGFSPIREFVDDREAGLMTGANWRATCLVKQCIQLKCTVIVGWKIRRELSLPLPLKMIKTNIPLMIF